MLKKRLVYGGLAVIGTLFFSLAVIFPLAEFFGPISAWTTSPPVCSAAIALVTIAASFPLWCARRRAWLVPLIASLLILLLDIPSIILVFALLVDNDVEFRWWFLDWGSTSVSLIPIYALTVSFSMMLAGAIVARKLCNPSAAFIEVKDKGIMRCEWRL